MFGVGRYHPHGPAPRRDGGKAGRRLEPRGLPRRWTCCATWTPTSSASARPRLSGASPMTRPDHRGLHALFLFPPAPSTWTWTTSWTSGDQLALGAGLRRGRGLGSAGHVGDLAGPRALHRDPTHRDVAAPEPRRASPLPARARWATMLDESRAFHMQVAAPGGLRCRAPNSVCWSPAGTCRPTTTSSPSAAGAGSTASGAVRLDAADARRPDRLAARRTSVSGGVPAGLTLDNWLSSPFALGIPASRTSCRPRSSRAAPSQS